MLLRYVRTTALLRLYDSETREGLANLRYRSVPRTLPRPAVAVADSAVIGVFAASLAAAAGCRFCRDSRSRLARWHPLRGAVRMVAVYAVGKVRAERASGHSVDRCAGVLALWSSMARRRTGGNGHVRSYPVRARQKYAMTEPYITEACYYEYQGPCVYAILPLRPAFSFPTANASRQAANGQTRASYPRFTASRERRNKMFVPGQIIRRRDLHSKYGGQEQGGISTPAHHSFIMLFTGESGLSHGYEDGWTESGIFLYSGEGQLGDMSFVRGNRALRDHLQEGRDVYLFEYVGPGHVRCVGQMMVTGYQERTGLDSAGRQRHTIVFELIPAEEASRDIGDAASDEDSSLDDLSDSDLRLITERTATGEMTPAERRETSHKRSQALRSYVLRRASGTCEGCGNKAPFVTRKGAPYLELHYLRRPSDVGPEDPSWVAALCPNCHKRAHQGSDAAQHNQRIINNITSR